MDQLITGAHIIDPNSKHHGQTVDLLIANGRFVEISSKLPAPAGVEIISANGLSLSPGWFDTYASFRDPGYEFKEDLQTGTDAAANGGFTAVAVIPDTDPALHSKSQIEYIIGKNQTHLTKVYPMGSISRDREGMELTEMFDMKNAGAIAFTEADKPVQNSALMLRALRYVLPFNGLIVNQPDDRYLSGRGMMHEGEVSTMLGMQGIPDLAESLMVNRDIELAEYTGSRVHLPALSAARSVALVRRAKSRGVKVTAGVAAYQLLSNEQAIQGYDTHFKVHPPLRGESDRMALIEGLSDGTIDVVCSNHRPQDEDAKKKEFELAQTGMSSVEVTFSLLNTALKDHLSLEKRIQLISENPRRIFGLPNLSIAQNEPADCTLFDPKSEWMVNASQLKSRATNNPWLGQTLTGRVRAVCNRGKFAEFE